ncbi:hypothetical protein LCGC14_1794190 [marine sediment metagenome]|uniref:Radical SAM core domain-containing protein n=1 Tax=marine sediment metagenome TaxID=412755 RepID=A0A0F9GRN7_9ZZZZ
MQNDNFEKEDITNDENSFLNLFEKNDEKFVEYRRKWEEWPVIYNIEDFPLFIDIEVTNKCNLKCPFCSTTISGNKNKKGFIKKIFMSISLFGYG